MIEMPKRLTKVLFSVKFDNKLGYSVWLILAK